MGRNNFVSPATTKPRSHGSSDTVLIQHRQTVFEQDQEPSRTAIRGIDSDLFSVVTDTDSTASNRTGPGRTVDGWLSRGGRLIDTAATAAASRMGAGPTPLFKSLLIRRNLKFTGRSCTCLRYRASNVIQLSERDIAPAETPSQTGDREAEWKISLRMAINLTQRLLCISCRIGYERAAAAEPSFTQNCRAMIKLIQRDANPTSKELAIFYIYLLWYLNPEFKQTMILSNLSLELSLLNRRVLFAADASCSRSGWLTSELQRLATDTSSQPFILRVDRYPTECHSDQLNFLRSRQQLIFWWLKNSNLKPVLEDSQVDDLIQLFERLPTTVELRGHGPLIPCLIRYLMARIFQWEMDSAAIISVLSARVHQQPQNCLGHIEFLWKPPPAMKWPELATYSDLSEKFLKDYALLCYDADVSPFTMIGLVTKTLSESLERRLVHWIRSVLPDLQGAI